MELAAGLDEAGRGCLAGPVVAAAVILPENFLLPGLGDSKALSVRSRTILAAQIRIQARAWSIGVVWPRRIEQVNILMASLEAMAQAASTLRLPPNTLLIDGNRAIPHSTLSKRWQKRQTAPLPGQRWIIHGDALEPPISAASILAKTFRDKLLCKLAKRWPGYGFEEHKGYATKMHYAALRKLGPCPLHRISFRGVLPSKMSAASQLELFPACAANPASREQSLYCHKTAPGRQCQIRPKGRTS